MKALYIEGRRNGYTPEQCGNTLTIKELIETLECLASEYGESLPVYICNDGGYTYGNIRDYTIEVYNNKKVLK